MMVKAMEVREAIWISLLLWLEIWELIVQSGFCLLRLQRPSAQLLCGSGNHPPPPPPSTDRQVSGIEGNFRNTAENVMRVLRTNKESVTAMLEAFVHDPLINWRLLTTADAATGVAGAAAALGPDGAPITPGTVRDAEGGG